MYSFTADRAHTLFASRCMAIPPSSIGQVMTPTTEFKNQPQYFCTRNVVLVPINAVYLNRHKQKMVFSLLSPPQYAISCYASTFRAVDARLLMFHFPMGSFCVYGGRMCWNWIWSKSVSYWDQSRLYHIKLPLICHTK